VLAFIVFSIFEQDRETIQMEEKKISEEFQIATATIAEISQVHAILEVICASTGMCFAAVSSVRDNRWITCAVLDEVQFGLVTTQELQLELSICDVIRKSLQRIAIDSSSMDSLFAVHPELQSTGVSSCISAPIVLPDGLFFGTLCAVDTRPAQVNNPTTIKTFELFANLIAMHLDYVRRSELIEAELNSIKGIP